VRLLPVAVLSLSIGAVGGYCAHGWLQGEHGDMPSVEQRMRADVVACTLSPEQIEHLSARIAPAVVQHLGDSRVAPPDPQVASQRRSADEKSRSRQAAAFAEAARMVDQMIADRAVSPQGRNRAHELLRESGQADRIYEIDGRIAAAINRGEITGEEAGLGPPPQ
jgi:hypothetical protein